MIRMKKQTLVLLIALLTILGTKVSAQEMVDRIVATVGEKVVLQSDVENQVLQMRAQGVYSGGDLHCDVLKELLIQKLLLNQAELDSVEVSASAVEQELDMRLLYFVRQVGSQKKLEDYYNKSMAEIKEDFRPIIRDQKITETMRRTITEGIKVSPKEVSDFYKTLPKDSIPMIDPRYKVAQIAAYPTESEEAKLSAREKLLELRERILKGERFATLAVLYSEDPGSARQGGEIGFRTRQELDPEFAKTAFGLKDGQVSRIVRSAFGYHIIQMIGREGEQVNVRHILIIPDISADQRQMAINKLDSLHRLVKQDSLTFVEAAQRNSEDERSRMSKGIFLNPMTASPYWGADELPAEEFEQLKNMKIGDISEPFLTRNEENKEVYKIIKLQELTKPHRANLDQDYEVVENMLILQRKKQKVEQWIKEKREATYIHIDEAFLKCEFLKEGWLK